MDVYRLYAPAERAAMRQEWARWQRTPPREWPADMDHAVPVTRYRCRLCGRDKLGTEYAQSELVTRWKRTQAGTPYLAAAQQRCRVCLRAAIRARTNVRRPRPMADEQVAS